MFGVESSGFRPIDSHKQITDKAQRKEECLPKDELIEALEDENKRLRAELEAMKKTVSQAGSGEKPSEGGRVEYDIATNVLRLEGIRAKDFNVEKLEVKILEGDAIEQDLLTPFNLSGTGVVMPDSLMIKLKKSPMEVTKARILIPEESATKVMVEGRRDALREAGIKSIGLEFAEGNQLILRGWAKKLIPIPFKVRGELSLTPDNRVQYLVREMDAGLLPMPKIIRGLVMSIADKTMHDTCIERKGDAYIIDPSAFYPANVKVSLTGIRTEMGNLAIEGGSPTQKTKVSTEVPKTISHLS